MNPTDPSKQNSGPNLNQQTPPPVSFSPGSGGAKEMEQRPTVESPGIEEVKELQVPKEVASHITQANDTIELPPDLTKIGVQPSAPEMSVTSPTQSGPDLPLSDDQIGQGLSEKPTSSFKWLAEWCLKQLKRMHMHIKRVGEHFTRVKDI